MFGANLGLRPPPTSRSKEVSSIGTASLSPPAPSGKSEEGERKRRDESAMDYFTSSPGCRSPVRASSPKGQDRQTKKPERVAHAKMLLLSPALASRSSACSRSVSSVAMALPFPFDCAPALSLAVALLAGIEVLEPGSCSSDEKYALTKAGVRLCDVIV